MRLTITIELGPVTRALFQSIGERIVSSIEKLKSAWSHLSTTLAQVKSDMDQHAAAVRAAATTDDADLEGLAANIESTAANLDTAIAAMHAETGTAGTQAAGAAGNLTQST